MAMGEARADSAAAKQEASNWSKTLARYRNPSAARSLIEIAFTIGPFVRLLWAATWLASTSLLGSASCSPFRRRFSLSACS